MIEIKGLRKAFANKTILNGVTLDINEGETLCIIGKSGCGKSVLLKNIVGLLQPDEGYIKIDGKQISNINQKELFAIRQNIGYVFQGAALFDSYNVFENVVLKLVENGEKDIAKLENEAKYVLSAVGLLPPIDKINGTVDDEFEKEWKSLSIKKPSELSGGMKKRVGVARALTGNPHYIFYDEPTTGLDPITSKQIDDLIANLAKKINVTSIVITHDMFSVENIADKVAMLSDGKLQYYGNAADIWQSNDSVVMDFLDRYRQNR
jgi:phospholipid/cholesterol/gamma-HCH transport system ATP-binding protein